MKAVLLNMINASILPLIIIAVSLTSPSSDSPALSNLIQIFNCQNSMHLAMASITTFALGYSFLSSLRWPFIIAAYITGGLSAIAINSHLFSSWDINPGQFGTYTLIGCCIIAALGERFRIVFTREVIIRGSACLLWLIVLDITFLFVKNRASANITAYWQAYLFLLTTGAIVGAVGLVLYKLLYAVPATQKLLNRVVCQAAAQQPQEVVADTPVSRTASAPVTSPAHAQPARSYPTTNTTSKLLSQTDLPRVKTANTNRNKSNEAETKPASSSSSDEDWLSKHLSALDD
jgi:hypothetical protein